jgi:hypothetical protein
MERWRITHDDRYEVSDLGRVRSFAKKSRGRYRIPHMLGIFPTKDGYLRVRIAGKTWVVHQLVASAFIGPCPPGQECLHKDDNRKNSRWSNLEYGTHRRNIQDCWKRGRGGNRKGEANGNARLTECQVLEIKHLLKVMTRVALSKQFRVHVETISRIGLGKRWAHL